MTLKKTGEVILNLFFCFIALGAFIIASGYTGYNQVQLGAKTFPSIVSILLVIFALSNIIKVFLGGIHKSEPVGVSDTDTQPSLVPDTVLNKFIARHRVVIAVAVVLLYYLLLNIFGFIISTLIFIPCMLFTAEYRKPLPMIVVTAGATVFLIISFQVLLGVPLTAGLLFR
jgi:hypothetical protein